MQFELAPMSLPDHATDLMVFCLHTDEQPPFATDWFSKVAATGDFTGKAGDALTLVAPSEMTAARCLLVGLGDADKVTAKTLDKAAKAIATAATKKGIESVTLAPQGALDEALLNNWACIWC